MARKSKADAERDLITEAQERFKRAAEAEDDQREISEDDLEFVAGNQWPDEIMEARQRAGRPTLTINRLPSRIRQAVTAMRRSNMAISVTAGDGGSDDIAEVYAGLVRQIERVSHADQAYDHAGELAATCGLGYWRVITDYADEQAFDQEIMIKPILSQRSVLWTSFVRILAGVMGLMLLALFHGQRQIIFGVFKPSRAWTTALPGAFIGNYLAMMAWLAGFKFTLVSVAAILNQLCTIFTFILAAIFLKERITPIRVLAIILAVGGALLATGAT